LRQLCAAGAVQTGKERRVPRWEHEEVLERLQARLDRKPQQMTVRRRTIEHVFGTLKHWMGSTHFLTRRLENVSTEMVLPLDLVLLQLCAFVMWGRARRAPIFARGV